MRRHDVKTDDRTPTRHPTSLCWRDLISQAVAGIYPSEQQLEHMLDHLERTP